MKKKVETYRYPCWIVCNENGVVDVYRDRGANKDRLPQKPVRHRAGVKTYSRVGFITVEEPVLDEGQGRWEMPDSNTRRFGFNPESSKKYFPDIKWEDEPVKGHISFNIEID